jgi:hypothetical protein
MAGLLHTLLLLIIWNLVTIKDEEDNERFADSPTKLLQENTFHKYLANAFLNRYAGENDQNTISKLCKNQEITTEGKRMASISIKVNDQSW